MRFLKTIQKREGERAEGGNAEPENNIPEKQPTPGENRPPQILSDQGLRIGAPSREAVTAAVQQEPLIRRTETQSIPEAVSMPVAVELQVPEVQTVEVDIAKVNPRVVSITQPHSQYCEEYRSLRTHVLHTGRKRKMQSIVVASVGPSEGKSITALNLSWMFAQADGVRALIIDSDLRRPSLAEYLGVKSDKGLSEVLTGKAKLLESIIKVEPAGLFLLPGGTARHDVAELISGRRFSELLHEARKHFDYIIIDAPPLGIFTDAALLMNMADGALLVVRAKHTRYKDLDRILETLPRQRILGTVLNQSDDSLMDESYYNYGFYGNTEPVRA